MKKILSGILLALALFGIAQAFSTPIAQAQRPLPPNDHAKGLVYDGLDPENSVPGLYKVRTNGNASKKNRFTSGPDRAPKNFNVALSVTPATTSPLASATLVCDGDGVSGKRVQVIYARASDVADRYDAYLASFQQWAAEADAEFYNSAMRTGESRHIRYVHGADCKPVVARVVLTPAGDDNFGQMISELDTQGFNRTDRKYMIFADARVYCGIGDILPDDQPGTANLNNGGQSYGRIDAGCWSGVIAAHELMHNLGGVQLSAPHSDGGWHCVDGFDNMCDRSGRVIQYTVCPDQVNDTLMDCNHDDYFNTNPAPGSYLATRWNTANSLFLIAPNSVHVQTASTGKLRGKNFQAISEFKSGDTVIVRLELYDQGTVPLAGANVSLTVQQPDGSVLCALSATSDSAGIAQAACSLPRKTTAGTWSVRVENVVKPGYTFKPNSATSLSFAVR